MGGRSENRVVAPPFPPPRVLRVARTQRSPGFGPSLAFPGKSQWHLSEESRARYSGGAAPELHRLPRISARVERLPGATILSLNGLRKQELSVPGST